MLAVVLAGGYAPEETGIIREMTGIRRAMSVDLIERLSCVPGCKVILLTDDAVLQRGVHMFGCAVRVTSQPFDWLREVQEAVRAEASPEEAVLVLGGAAAPFLTEGHVQELMELAEAGVVWQNNRLSPDLVLFQPASAAGQVERCATDNEFGYALEQQAGLIVRYLPRELAYAFDVDTPLDALLAGMHEEAGSRLCAAVSGLKHRVPLQEALEVLRRGEYPDVALIGRVHPVEAERFGQNAGVRLRLYSEERGMKALGRIEAGLVRSVTGRLAEVLGWRGFFEELAACASLVLFDTRVVMAERGVVFSEKDRYAADLGWWEEIDDPWLREMTRAAVEAPVPVLMGGQSLVSGGLRLLTPKL